MRGTYTVILKCRRRMRVRFGKLGYATLAAGHYLYTGSGLGRGAVSLEGRLLRHKRASKKTRWHVDYLTSREGCVFVGAVYLGSNKRLECEINRAICHDLHVQLILPNLGASDCNCEAHLVRMADNLDNVDVADRIKRVYSRFGVPHFFGDVSRSVGLLPIVS